MKTFTFTFDGHDYHIANADDDQCEPRHGDTIRGADGVEVCYVTHDGENWVAEDCSGPGYSTIHENEPDAAWSAVLSCIAGTY
jgi:hypothetical protein